ncbi:thiol:disulfide interchange protein [Filimonas lacunae]|nr:thiol:disulfide interchange protein [Filimonas lacunae]
MLSTGAALFAAPVPDSMYVIQGQIDGADSGYVYVSYEYNHQPHLDSAKLIQGTFVLSGYMPEPLQAVLKVSGSMQQFPFFTATDTITIKAHKQRLFDTEVTGSPEQQAYASYRRDYMGKVPPRKAPGDTAFARGLDKAAEDFILDHTGNYCAAMVLYDKFIVYMNKPTARRLYNKLEPKVQQSAYGKRILYMLDSGNRTGIGMKAPYFELPDSNGVKHAVTEFRGKYVLIDFWASWCVPCRKENPGLVKAYQQYHSKGLEIVSISLDSNKPQWLASAAKDNLTWLQLCDLKAYGGAITELYGVHAIPQNYMLDKEGNIMAVNLRGEKWVEFVNQLFAGK